MNDLRDKMSAAKFADEAEVLDALKKRGGFNKELRQRITKRAVGLVRDIRDGSDPTMMELFLGEYGLSSEEGVALMCLAEALLRVPDTQTIDALIEDKIAPSEWGAHLGHSHSSLVNASTWALFMTGKVLSEPKEQSISSILRGSIKRLGEPVIRRAVSAAMKEMGRQFVLGETIGRAMHRAEGMEANGYTYSYDMLGEAARTDADAKRYHMAYADAIAQIAKAATAGSTRDNPGISIKLSALHPRYEQTQEQSVIEKLMPRARALAILAKSANIGLNIDAEEAGRLDLSLTIIEEILKDPALEGWDGFGVVVQAYSKRASLVLDWLYALAEKLDRRIMVRLVKGAYWDTEIKHAQVMGLPGFPVFTYKPATDVSYLCCAKILLGMTDRIYPQFATHNAHSVAAILEMAEDNTAFEFQRLHGMGEALHQTVLARQKTACRIYAPVGAHKDLLAYLVRRLLENGANSSFVNQIVDETVAPEEVAADPFEKISGLAKGETNPILKRPQALFAPNRVNSVGFDLEDGGELQRISKAVADVPADVFQARHLIGTETAVVSPTTKTKIGSVKFASVTEAQKALDDVSVWEASPEERRQTLLHAADLYEENWPKFFALLGKEAGKTINDCVGELREAVDFLRYYANQIDPEAKPCGVFSCISPWNFPLAIFTGQISAALAAGNGVVAKPAEATSLIADFAVGLLYEAGVPKAALKLIAGEGGVIGPVVTDDPRVSGVCFTGSTATAKRIDRVMAENLSPNVPLIAETGGINAMIVDSSALPEQAVADVISSAFQSAGQRCSALRVLYVQEDIAENFKTMLFGAVDCLTVGDPFDTSTDIGPLIDQVAFDKITAYIAAAKKEERLLKSSNVPEGGYFVAPSVVGVSDIRDLDEEIFGPVLHLATFKAEQIEDVINDINSTGYGLTFGLHTRIDDRVQHIVDRVHCGNIYVNRNQIGAIVESQPFGGHGLSGTGPKAGGPLYMSRFTDKAPEITFKPIDLAGPTGESNRYLLRPKNRVFCLGPGAQIAAEQAELARSLGCTGTVERPDASLDWVAEQNDIGAVLWWGEDARPLRQTLAAREGAIVPLLTEQDAAWRLFDEISISIDTTASGGNAELIGAEE